MDVREGVFNMELVYLCCIVHKIVDAEYLQHGVCKGSHVHVDRKKKIKEISTFTLERIEAKTH